MNVLQVPAQVATLREGFVAFGAGERSQAGVLAEVVTEVAALLEGARASRVFTLEEKLDALSVRVLHFDRLVPFFRDAFEVLGDEVLVRFYPVFVVDHILVVVTLVTGVILVGMRDTYVLRLSRVPRRVVVLVNFDRTFLVIFTVELPFLLSELIDRISLPVLWLAGLRLEVFRLRRTSSRKDFTEFLELFNLLRVQLSRMLDVVRLFLTKKHLAWNLEMFWSQLMCKTLALGHVAPGFIGL